MNFRYPIFLDLTGKDCLVIGEGFEIAVKIRTLVEAGACVTYINPRAEGEIRALAAAGKAVWHAREFQVNDLSGRFLVISDLESNAEVFRAAEQSNILCNSVDDPENCRFSFGSIHRQSDLTIAISTNGWAPALAVRLKQKLERDIGAEYGALLEILKEARPEIANLVQNFDVRRALWYRIVDSEAIELLRNGRKEAARELVQRIIDEASNNTSRSDISAEAGNP